MRSIVIFSLPCLTIAVYGLATKPDDSNNGLKIPSINGLMARFDSGETSLTPDENLCHGISGNYWVMSRDAVFENAKEFCTQERQMVIYNEDSENMVELYVENLDPEKDERSPKDAPDCLGRFQGAVIDGCDGNDPLNNPHNYKFGSTLKANNWIYRMRPLAEQVNEVRCDVSWKSYAANGFEVRGKNLPDALLGANGEGLRKELSGCGELTKWNFERTPDNCCFQWYAAGDLPGGTKSCIGRAIRSAGGSSNGGCRGPGKRDTSGIESWPGYGDSGRHVFTHPAWQAEDQVATEGEIKHAT
jgi:hypothetical protein